MEYNYVSPLNERYSSNEMKKIFSSENKFTTWRKLWLTLAKGEKELGLNISDEQIKELEENLYNLNIDVAKEREKIVRHDVMSHVYAYGVQCPKAKGIIHLGATSCYVGDNTDIIVMHEALNLIRIKLVSVMKSLSKFCDEYKDLPTLGFTHFQAAQLTTVGKRASLWLHDLQLDYEEICSVINSLKLRGVKGTTGTQASFLELFKGDSNKVKKLDSYVAKAMGFNAVYPVTGQTYSRKIDSRILNCLSSIAQSASKFSNDMRLLQNLKELEEPFNKNQIGSSAMAYKRNPMRSERITSLSRFVISNSLNPAFTAASQWLERTLDDSANKRLAVTECFLTIDAILDIYLNITTGIVVYPKIIEKHINEELPFMATENIIMMCVKKGMDRQEVHEIIRKHSMEAGKHVKIEGKDNNLIKLLCSDKELGLNEQDLINTFEAKNYIGRSTEQVGEYLETLKPIFEEYSTLIKENSVLNV
ncbi:MAG: adenylosuccinate lyase [Lachnospirales bacterium]